MAQNFPSYQNFPNWLIFYLESSLCFYISIYKLDHLVVFLIFILKASVDRDMDAFFF